MKRMAEKIHGPVGEVFSRALYEIALGESREKAFRGMCDSISIQGMGQFTGSVIQAEQLGVSIGKILRTQTAMLWRKRRLRAEEHARKAPIKILFPLVLLIFPSLFVVILGPAIVTIIREFLEK
jgi:tight adherence protein C